MADERAGETFTELVSLGSDSASVELARAAWLDAKAHRTGSRDTVTAYRSTLDTFRDVLRGRGMDLDGDPHAIALVAQVWLSRKRDGVREVKPASYNQRRAVLSSFYAFAMRRGLLPGVTLNPLAMLDARPVEAYGGALPLPADWVNQQLADIDRSELMGLRDYALLSVGLHTGRRAAELAGLVCGDLEEIEGGARLHVTWRHCKGGKVRRNKLGGQVAAALTRYLCAVYGASWPAEAPVWVTMGPNRRGTPLSTWALEDVCMRRLGTGKVHALRHTFAVEMERAGAPVSLIQYQLGHSSLAVTGRYLAQLNNADNPYAGRLEEAFMRVK